MTSQPNPSELVGWTVRTLNETYWPDQASVVSYLSGTVNYWASLGFHAIGIESMLIQLDGELQ